MNKQDMVNSLANATGATKVMAAQMLDTFVDLVTKSLKKGDKVTLTGFGTFEVRRRGARKGVTAFNGKAWSTPATKVPAFKAGKGLKSAVK